MPPTKRISTGRIGSALALLIWLSAGGGASQDVDHFTELFEDGDFDLDGISMTFTPEARHTPLPQVFVL